MKDSVELSPAVANGLSLALKQDFYAFETPERMAFIVLVLRFIKDDETFFPCGKWATIQNIQRQLEDIAKVKAALLEGGVE